MPKIIVATAMVKIRILPHGLSLITAIPAMIPKIENNNETIADKIM